MGRPCKCCGTCKTFYLPNYRPIETGSSSFCFDEDYELEGIEETEGIIPLVTQVSTTMDIDAGKFPLNLIQGKKNVGVAITIYEDCLSQNIIDNTTGFFSETECSTKTFELEPGHDLTLFIGSAVNNDVYSSGFELKIIRNEISPSQVEELVEEFGPFQAIFPTYEDLRSYDIIVSSDGNELFKIESVVITIPPSVSSIPGKVELYLCIDFNGVARIAFDTNFYGGGGFNWTNVGSSILSRPKSYNYFFKDASLSGEYAGFITNPETTVLTSGTAQGGTENTIQLSDGETFDDDALNGAVINITGGTGNGQTRAIIDYAGDTDIATITPNWATNPDDTSIYRVVVNGTMKYFGSCFNENSGGPNQWFAAYEGATQDCPVCSGCWETQEVERTTTTVKTRRPHSYGVKPENVETFPSKSTAAITIQTNWPAVERWAVVRVQPNTNTIELYFSPADPNDPYYTNFEALKDDFFVGANIQLAYPTPNDPNPFATSYETREITEYYTKEENLGGLFGTQTVYVFTVDEAWSENIGDPDDCYMYLSQSQMDMTGKVRFYANSDGVEQGPWVGIEIVKISTGEEDKDPWVTHKIYAQYGIDDIVKDEIVMDYLIKEELSFTFPDGPEGSTEIITNVAGDNLGFWISTLGAYITTPPQNYGPSGDNVNQSILGVSFTGVETSGTYENIQDEVISTGWGWQTDGLNHVIGGKELILSGLAVSATSDTIELSNDTSLFDDFLNGAEIKIIEGAGKDQTRTISDYDGSTNTVIINSKWETIPNNSSTYQITVNKTDIIYSFDIDPTVSTVDQIPDYLDWFGNLTTEGGKPEINDMFEVRIFNNKTQLWDKLGIINPNNRPFSAGYLNNQLSYNWDERYYIDEDCLNPAYIDYNKVYIRIIGGPLEPELVTDSLILTCKIKYPDQRICYDRAGKVRSIGNNSRSYVFEIGLTGDNKMYGCICDADGNVAANWNDVQIQSANGSHFIIHKPISDFPCDLSNSGAIYARSTSVTGTSLEDEYSQIESCPDYNYTVCSEQFVLLTCNCKTNENYSVSIVGDDYTLEALNNDWEEQSSQERSCPDIIPLTCRWQYCEEIDNTFTYTADDNTVIEAATFTSDGILVGGTQWLSTTLSSNTVGFYVDLFLVIEEDDLPPNSQIVRDGQPLTSEDFPVSSLITFYNGIGGGLQIFNNLQLTELNNIFNPVDWTGVNFTIREYPVGGEPVSLTNVQSSSESKEDFLLAQPSAPELLNTECEIKYDNRVDGVGDVKAKAFQLRVTLDRISCENTGSTTTSLGPLGYWKLSIDLDFCITDSAGFPPYANFEFSNEDQKDRNCNIPISLTKTLQNVSNYTEATYLNKTIQFIEALKNITSLELK